MSENRRRVYPIFLKVPSWPSRFCFPHGSKFCKNKDLVSNQILILKSFLDHLIHTWLKFMLSLCTKNEHPEKQWWWLSKLESLIVKVRENKMDELNCQDIVSSKAESIKQIFYEVYKVAYD